MTSIKKIAVLGSGVMGSGIAAHAANAGIPVILLDIVPTGAENRNMLTEKALERIKTTGALIHPKRAGLITIGNLEDDLSLLADVDWIIEAVLEKREVKQAVYKKIDAVRKIGSVVSSNTSTIPLQELTEGLSAHFAGDCMIAHFFNPPRYMRLLEVVKSPNTRNDAYDAVCEFADVYLGKEIVPCKDTPGFIANRIGVYWMTAALNEALKLHISVEDADAVMSKPIGVPKTGVFGLYDLIGLDLMPLIAHEMLRALPDADAFRALNAEPELLKKLIKEGYTGRKSKGGFTRMVNVDGKKTKEVLDLKTGEYRPEHKESTLKSTKARSVSELVAAEDIGGQFARAVLAKTLHYAASLAPYIADDITLIDAAMRTGYNWKFGPFELIDQIGTTKTAELFKQHHLPLPALFKAADDRPFYTISNGEHLHLEQSGGYVPLPHKPGTLFIHDLSLKQKPLLANGSGRLWDIGDGIACLEFTTKMNAIDHDIIHMIEQVIPRVSADFKGLVIGSDGDNFSAGANLSYFLEKAKTGDFTAISAMIEQGQHAFMALKYAPFPTVSALTGLALGGGCEVLLHSTHVQAHVESYAGLVEVNVGLIPAWGGCKEMLLRHGNAETPFELILNAKTAGSSDDARDMKILKDCCHITMNRARVLADAKARCIEAANNYAPPAKAMMPRTQAAQAALNNIIAQKGEALSPHSRTIALILTHVLASDDTSEEAALKREHDGFMELIKTAPTLARIEHILKTGKPLKN